MGATGSGDEIVFVSDLHLGAYPPGRSSFYDSSFTTFVDHLCERQEDRDEGVRLVLLGDFLDFLAIGHRGGTDSRIAEDTSAERALEKLDLIASEHASVFAALGRFASLGLPIDVVPGNHDLELLRTSAQDRLRELTGELSGCPAPVGAIRFHPWIFHIEGQVYAEHGHQHHDINACTTLLRPDDPARPGTLERPLAAHLVHLEGRSGLQRVNSVARTAAAVVRHAANLASPGRARRRAAYQREVLEDYARELRLQPQSVIAIDRLSDASPVSIALRLLRRAVVRPWATPGRSPYLYRAAARIHRVLEASGENVPFYVFGHTHFAERRPIGGGRTPASYLNTGTWSPAVPRGVGPSPLLTFVRLKPGTGTAPPEASVLAWDEQQRRPTVLDDVVRPASKRSGHRCSPHRQA